VKATSTLWLGMAGILSLGPAHAIAATIWASPTGKSASAGNEAAPLDVGSAIAKLTAGDSLLLKPGTYAIPYTTGAINSLVCAVKATQASPIVVRSPTGRAVLDFGFPEDTYVQNSFGISLTGNWWTFERIDVTRAGYQGTYVTGSHNTFDNCRFYQNRNSGVEVNKLGEYTLLHNVDAFDNYDPKKTGSMSDGFAIKQTMGPGNRLVGCRSWNNSDDGYDTYDSPEFVTLDSCWAFRNGWYHGDPNDSRNNASMNGNGFKVGGMSQLQRNVLRHCVSVGNKARGFDQNSNTGGVTIVNSTSYRNGTQNFSFSGSLASGEKNVFTNNISLQPGAADGIASATSNTNTWNSIAVAASDFQSTDTSLAVPARNDDGSIPQNTFLRLKSTSKLIDAGSSNGFSYLGKAPDLGAFEAIATATTRIAARTSGTESVRWHADKVVLSLELAEAARVRIRVIGASGQNLSEARTVAASSGSNRIELPAAFEHNAFVVLERDGKHWKTLSLAGI
jgi:Right handed beta helix region